MFTNVMAHRATTMSLSILVTVEMFNAMNSLSENESLFVLPVWKNPFLVVAIAISMALHFAILYIPAFSVRPVSLIVHFRLHAVSLTDFLSFVLLFVRSLQTLFAITPLNWEEWKAVIYLSLPVIAIDEVLKFVSVNQPHPVSPGWSSSKLRHRLQTNFVEPPTRVKAL